MSLRLNETSYQRVEQLATEVCQREGCFVYDIEFVGGSRGKGKKLRVFIDKDAENGVSIDDCANVSRGLSLLLDVEEDLLPEGAYDLEVSSPGLERKLRKPWHFEKVVGQTIELRVTQPFSQYNDDPKLKNRMAAQGVVTTSDDSKIHLAVQGLKSELEVPIEYIQKAKVIFEYKSSKKK